MAVVVVVDGGGGDGGRVVGGEAFHGCCWWSVSEWKPGSVGVGGCSFAKCIRLFAYYF